MKKVLLLLIIAFVGVVSFSYVILSSSSDRLNSDVYRVDDATVGLYKIIDQHSNLSDYRMVARLYRGDEYYYIGVGNGRYRSKKISSIYSVEIHGEMYYFKVIE